MPVCDGCSKNAVTSCSECKDIHACSDSDCYFSFMVSCFSCGCDICCACGDASTGDWKCNDCSYSCSICGTDRCDDDPHECEHPKEVHTNLEGHYVCACCGTTTADYGDDLWG